MQYRNIRTNTLRCTAIPWVLCVGLSVQANAAHAFLDYPWCMGDGGGPFLCQSKEERVQVAQSSVDLDYLQFVQRAFVAPTISYFPPGPGDSVAVTLHRAGGGIIELQSPNSGRVRTLMQDTAGQWFQSFCTAKGGRSWIYPDDPEAPATKRYACHPKSDAVGVAPMFGVQASRAVVYRQQDALPVVAMQHFPAGEALLKAWGYPRVFKAGDMAAQGMVIELKAPLAKIQQTIEGRVQDVWIRIKELRPTTPPAAF